MKEHAKGLVKGPVKRRVKGYQTEVATAAGFAGGVLVGMVVWSQQTRKSRRNLFSADRWRRLAALGYMRGQPSARNIQLLRDYVRWEQSPRLRRSGESILRQMEQSLD